RSHLCEPRILKRRTRRKGNLVQNGLGDGKVAVLVLGPFDDVNADRQTIQGPILSERQSLIPGSPTSHLERRRNPVALVLNRRGRTQQLPPVVVAEELHAADRASVPLQRALSERERSPPVVRSHTVQNRGTSNGPLLCVSSKRDSVTLEAESLSRINCGRLRRECCRHCLIH